MNNNKRYTLAIIGGLTILFFLFIGSFFQPGEIDLTTPTHSDLYRYYMVSDNRWLLSTWLTPRPLSLAYLKIAGLLHNPTLFFLWVALPAFLFLMVLPYLLIEMGLLQPEILPLAAFLFVSFGSPLFYRQFQLDFGGMLSGVFAVFAVRFGYEAIKGINKNDLMPIQTTSSSTGNMGLVHNTEMQFAQKGRHEQKHTFYYLIAALFFSLLSVETKPTYSVLLLALAGIAALFVRGSRSKWLLIGTLFVLVWVFVKDKLLSSPFLASSEASSPYAVIINPMKNIEALSFYMKNAFTIPLGWVVLLASIVFLINHKWKLLVFILILAISASIPMALIPNHHWSSYAWYTTVILGLLVMIAVSQLLNIFNKSHDVKKRVLAAIGLGMIIVGLIFHALSQPSFNEFTLADQRYNRNLTVSLSLINNSGGSKILLAGLHGPYHPVQNTAFVERVFPNVGKFDVLLRKRERAWNEMAHEKTNGIYLDEVNWNNYSKIFIFDEKGCLCASRSSDEIARLPRYQQNLLFYSPSLDITRITTPQTIVEAIRCLNDNEEYADSIALVSAQGNMEEKADIYFYLAKAYQATGDLKTAGGFFEKALHLEPGNTVYATSLKENDLIKNKTILNSTK